MRIAANCCFQKFDFFLVPFQRAIVAFLHLDSAFSLHCSSLPSNILKINKNQYFPQTGGVVCDRSFHCESKIHHQDEWFSVKSQFNIVEY